MTRPTRAPRRPWLMLLGWSFLVLLVAVLVAGTMGCGGSLEGLLVLSLVVGLAPWVTGIGSALLAAQGARPRAYALLIAGVVGVALVGPLLGLALGACAADEMASALELAFPTATLLVASATASAAVGALVGHIAVRVRRAIHRRAS